MEKQRFVQQNIATTTQKPSVKQQPTGKTRSGESSSGRFEVRVDPPQNRVRSPRSRADQLNKFVAQFQAQTARQDPGNVGAELVVQTPTTPVPPMVNRATKNPQPLPTSDQQKVEEAIQAIDAARQQFAHSAGISRIPTDEVRSVKTPYPTSTEAGIVATVSEAIASEVNSAQTKPASTSSKQPAKIAPVTAIRKPFFAKPSVDTAPARPEVVFEKAPAPLSPVAVPVTLSANGLATQPNLETTWDAVPMNPKPMINLAIREPQETEVVELPDSLLREIADQHRQFEAEEVSEESQPQTDGDVRDAISVDLAAWDVEAFRWSQVTEDILNHAGPVMDQLTHYSLDILTGNENRIAVAGLKRGQGTSTIAAAVARWAVANGKRVLLVDADLGNPELSRTAGLSPNVSWLNLIREDLIPSEAIIRSKKTGVCIMPLAAVVTPQSWPGHIYDRLGGLIEQVRHGFDLVLMDVGPVGQLSNELSNHALMSDALMIVDENPSSADFVNAKAKLLKSGVRKFIAAQNSVGTASI